jgi:hypothetical protein
MAYRLEVRGGDVLGGGMTPDERYGVGVWGPAIMGVLNVTNLTDEQASEFSTEELARMALILLYPLTSLAPSCEFRIEPTV